MTTLDDIRSAVDHGRAIPAAQARLLFDRINQLELAAVRHETRVSHYGNETMMAAARAVSLEIAAQAVIDRYADGGWPAASAPLHRLQQAIDARRDPIPLADMVAAAGCYRIAVQYGGTAEAIEAAQAALFAANEAVYGIRKEQEDDGRH